MECMPVMDLATTSLWWKRYGHRRKIIKWFPLIISILCWLAASCVLNSGSVKLEIKSSRKGESHTTWLLMKSSDGCCSCSLGSVLRLGPWKGRLSKYTQSTWTHVPKLETLSHLDGKDMFWFESNRIWILLHHTLLYMCSGSKVIVKL